jgi:hypothetical protein
VGSIPASRTKFVFAASLQKIARTDQGPERNLRALFLFPRHSPHRMLSRLQVGLGRHALACLARFAYRHAKNTAFPYEEASPGLGPNDEIFTWNC